MPTSFGEPLTKLRAVPIRENGEPLVDPRTLTKRIGYLEKHPRFAEMTRDARVRRSVAEMLAAAADALPKDLQLTIIEGFRPLAQQRFMYEHLKAEFAQRHPEWSRATLHRITNQLSAPPDDPCPPPHSTGGAVDICIVHKATGDFLDVTSPLPWDETSAATAVKGLSPEAQANRDLLVRTLSATGLTNYIGEWWHWSYGDSGWALRTGAEWAVYDRLAEAG
jgi:D-alanyl-D-alanine dipeptidase